MDFMKSGERLPFTKLQLKEIAQNARNIYSSTVDNKKSSVIAVAIKITALIEAAEKNNIPIFQTDNESKSKPAVSTLPFLTDAEHSIVEYCCEKTDETKVVAEKIPYLRKDVPHPQF